MAHLDVVKLWLQRPLLVLQVILDLFFILKIIKFGVVEILQLADEQLSCYIELKCYVDLLAKQLKYQNVCILCYLIKFYFE